MLDSLQYCQKHKRLKLYAYCLLINHLHLIFSVEQNNPENFIRDFKRNTTTQTHKLLKQDKELVHLNRLRYITINRKNTNFRLWQRSIFPEEIITQKFLEQKINYVDLNPTHHHITNYIEKYPYTSFHNHFCKHKNMLNTATLPLLP